MKWLELEFLSQLDDIDRISVAQPVMIYKHSTRCGVSSSSKNRLEEEWKEKDSVLIDTYFLDLLKHRDISNDLAKRYNIRHESPQILLIVNGKCVYSENHYSISFNAVRKQISTQLNP